MGGGGKSSKQSVQMDPKLTEAARDALDRADTVSRLPYIPNRGVQIAAFTPMQQAAMSGNNSLAASLGLKTVNPNAGMPKAESVGGVRGYSTGAVYDDSMRKSISPELRRSIDMLFANAKTGKYYEEESPLATHKYGAGGKTNDVASAFRGAGQPTSSGYDPSINRK